MIIIVHRCITKFNINADQQTALNPGSKLQNEINFGDSIDENLYEKIIIKNFVGSSKSIRDKYFILKNNEIVETNKIIKHLNGQIQLIVNPLPKLFYYISRSHFILLN